MNSNFWIISITIPDTVTKIGNDAFAFTRITKFNMPDSVTEIGTRIFFACNELTEVRLSDNLAYIPKSTFEFPSKYPSTKLKKVNLPKNLKDIGYLSFSGCFELIELTIPDNIKSIRFVDDFLFPEKKERPDNMAFLGCGKLPLKTRQTIKDFGYKDEF